MAIAVLMRHSSVANDASVQAVLSIMLAFAAKNHCGVSNNPAFLPELLYGMSLA